jgi:hypothetical protein
MSEIDDAVKALESIVRILIHDSFAAGWHAFFKQHGHLLISGGMTNSQQGLEEAWKAYCGEATPVQKP